MTCVCLWNPTTCTQVCSQQPQPAAASAPSPEAALALVLGQGQGTHSGGAAAGQATSNGQQQGSSTSGSEGQEVRALLSCGAAWVRLGGGGALCELSSDSAQALLGLALGYAQDPSKQVNEHTIIMLLALHMPLNVFHILQVAPAGREL